MVKRRGPRTDPWGIPWITAAVVELKPLRVMNCFLFEVGLEPREYCVSEANELGETREEDGMEDSVKGCRDV